MVLIWLKNKLSSKVNEVIERNSKVSTAISEMEKINKACFLSVAQNSTDYVNKSKTSTIRVILIILGRMSCISIAIKFVLSAITAQVCIRITYKNNINSKMFWLKPWIRDLICDQSFLFGNHTLVSLMCFAFAVGILSILVVLTYQEINRTAYFIEIIQQLKSNTIEYPLNFQNERKFAISFNLMIKPVKKLLILTIILTWLLAAFATTLAYRHPDTNFQVINIIFWSIMSVVFITQCFGVLWFGFLLWFGCSLYLMFKFSEVFEKIQLITRNPKNVLNGYRILKAIEEHNFVHIMTEKMNHFFRMITLIIYLMGAPGFLVCLYLTHHKESSGVTRIYSMVIFFTCFIPVVAMNLLSSRIDRAAKMSLDCLQSYLSHGNPRLTISKRLKILSFLEHLTGADIGFSCYTLFHMDMMAFFEFIYMCGGNYFLLLSLF